MKLSVLEKAALWTDGHDVLQETRVQIWTSQCGPFWLRAARDMCRSITWRGFLFRYSWDVRLHMEEYDVHSLWYVCCKYGLISCKTRMHSIRMRTVGSLTVSRSIWHGGGCMPCTPLPHTPPTTHPPCHACHPPCTPPAMHTPLPCTHPCHAHTPGTHAPLPCRHPYHARPPWIEWQMFVKLLPCPKLRLRAVKWKRLKGVMDWRNYSFDSLENFSLCVHSFSLVPMALTKSKYAKTNNKASLQE